MSTKEQRGPMDAETLEALKGSIAKWEGIVAGEPETDCPLCVMFRNKHSDGYCDGCPVMEKTGKQLCRGTPYWDDDSPEQRQAELDFLKSLLPVQP